MLILSTKDRKMSLAEKAAKGIVKQVRKGLAVQDAQGQPDIDKMLAGWSVGFQQYLTGKSTALLVENFLALFTKKDRDSMEADILPLHRVRSFQRFRKTVLLTFAVPYPTHAAAQPGSATDDIPG